ncbi:YkvA family protein [Luteimonas sp. MC1825]|uniref:YkvA family protein n=1 Tax=Luteimonas sp. MC1825 TaxID=2761107 RepID=UPI001C880286|nr:YkvA family protein [Luteimonas sp. MC1825]
MSISLTIELNDRDLAHFTKAMDAARAAAAHMAPEAVVAAAASLLGEAQGVHIPDFVRQRLLRLDDMIAMVRDEGWALGDEDRQRVLSVLVYFADPKDVIPDHIEVLGFLDDAIMIELSVRELQHELDAYDDFCDFREHQAHKRGIEPAAVGRADWLDSRREELMERMHARRERDFGVGYGASSGYRSQSSYVRTWRPSLFKLR